MTTTDLTFSANDYMIDSSPTVNTLDQELQVGEWNAGVSTRRSWLKPDFSPVTPGDIISSAVLKITPISDLSDNARTMSCARCLRAAVGAQMTWNVYSTGNNWGTGGASGSGTDFDATALGTLAIPASPTLNSQMSMTLNATEIQKMFDGTYTNNGFVLFVDTQLNDLITYGGRAHATTAYRPILTVVHAAPGWTNIAKVNGVASASIAKVDGIAVASISKVNGVAV